MDAPAKAGKNNFDTLRLFFATLVVYSHSYPLLRGSDETEPLFHLTHGVLTLGQISVWSFFVISGFLITQSWQRSPKLSRFLNRRITRIYPGFIVATLLCASVVYPLATVASERGELTWVSYVTSTLRLQMFPNLSAFPHNPVRGAVNGSLWSIPFEFWCYIGVAVLGMTKLLSRRLLVAFLMLVTMLAHLLIEVQHLTPGGKVLGRIFGYPVFWSILLPFFLAGMLLQLYGEKVRFTAGYAGLAALLLAASFFIPHAPVFTLPLLGSYLLMWLAYVPWLNGLQLGRWGDFSYGTYLYAYPIQQLLVLYFLPRLTPPVLFVIAAPLSIAAGVLSWHLVEKHFLPRKTIRRLEAIESGSKVFTVAGIGSDSP